MNNQAILYGIVGVLLGGMIALLAVSYAVNSNNTNMIGMMGMNGSRMMRHSDMSMSEMISNLQGKTGEDFDKAFIIEMIAHHQGAIGMASLARQDAKHDEIKQLADRIIDAQTREINQMKAWEVSWGYVTSTSPNQNDTDAQSGMISR